MMGFKQYTARSVAALLYVVVAVAITASCLHYGPDADAEYAAAHGLMREQFGMERGDVSGHEPIHIPTIPAAGIHAADRGAGIAGIAGIAGTYAVLTRPHAYDEARNLVHPAKRYDAGGALEPAAAYVGAPLSPPSPHESFDTKWRIHASDKTIRIYVTSATGSYMVDWGDGSTSTYEGPGKITKTYDAAGTYIVRMSGDFTGIRFVPDRENAAKLASIEQWGNIRWTTMKGAFAWASNMTHNATDVPDLSNVTDMSFMFDVAIKFNGDISSWNVSNVEDMYHMFSDARSFNQPLDSWDVSNVTDMSGMFGAADSFNQPLDSWDVSNVTDMSGMFWLADSFNQPLDSWDVSNVTDMSEMFWLADSFNQPLDSWDVSNVTDMSGMFGAAKSFNQPLDSWDVSNVTDMYGMFWEADSFNQPLDSWDVSGVKDMSKMFSWAVSFNQPLDSWDISNVEDAFGMFGVAKSFNQPINSWDVSGVVDMRGMFNTAESFNQPIGDWDVSGARDMAWMFANTDSFNQPLDSWDVSSVLTMHNMFENARYNQNLGKWYIVPDDTVADRGDAKVTTISTQNRFLYWQDPVYGIAPGGDGHLFEMRGNVLAYTESEYTKTSYDVTITSTGGFSSPHYLGISVTVAADTDPPTPDPSSPIIWYAGITGPNLVTVEFSESMAADLDSFEDIALSGEALPRAFTILGGSGTDRFELAFDGPPAPPDATAVMTMAGGIADSDGNLLVSSGVVDVSDGQAPALEDVFMSSSSGDSSAGHGDTVTLAFTASEAITHVRTSINEKAVTTAGTGGNSWSASKRIGAADPAGTVDFAIDFVDAAGNAGARATYTTNGSTVSVTRDVVTSEGARGISSDRTNAAGYTGKEVNVAVIDTGFDVTNPEFSSNIVETRSFANLYGIGSDPYHGTAVAEIITDIAPDARLHLYSISTDVEFLAAADYITGRGDIDIISMSLGWFNDVGPADGTSRMAQKVDEARNSGILWINSAGNEAQRHWQGAFHNPDGDAWHNFAGDDEALDLERGSYLIRAVLSWDDWDSTSQDFALCLLNSEVVVKCTRNAQPGSGPFEYLEHQFDAYGASPTPKLAIKKVSATRDVSFQLFSLHHNLGEYRVPTSSLRIPADSNGVMTVAASHVGTDALEPYSSHGPTLDGRTKPDISAPARVSTATYGTGGFDGTSAAAPHVAGAAALVMQKYPDATASQVQKMLESVVKFRHAKSNQDGTGQLDVSAFILADVLAANNSNPECASDGTCFLPETLHIQTGDTVTWINADTAPVRMAGPGFESTSITRGQAYSATFNSTGTARYNDSLHPWAMGVLVVDPDSAPPEIRSAGITAPNRATVQFSEDVTVLDGSFAAVVISGEPDAREITGVSGSGSDAIDLAFGGLPVPVTATGAILMSDGIVDTRGNAYAGPRVAIASDGQAPKLDVVSIGSSNAHAGIAVQGDTITLRFEASEPIRNVWTTISSGIADLSELGGNQWSASWIVDKRTHGDVGFSISYEDEAGNQGTRAWETTDGTRVYVWMPHPSYSSLAAVTGVICIDVDRNGTCDAGELAPEPPFNTMHLVPPADSGMRHRTAESDADGRYRFDGVAPDMEWTVRTSHFPPGHIVQNEASSWFTRVTPKAEQLVPFDVAFLPVPASERVTLDLRTYDDANRNGVRDAGEDGIPGLMFETYTYSTGLYGAVITGADGTATMSDLLPANWALLGFPDGYDVTSTEYARSDGVDGKGYHPGRAVVDRPEPGSIHTMTFGLWRAP